MRCARARFKEYVPANLEVYSRFTNSVNCINISVMKKLVVIWCIFLLAGCAHFKEISRVDSLERISVLYEKTLRWGSYEEAVLFMEGGPEQQITNIEELKEFKVTSYELLSRDISPDMFNAQQTVEIKYYHNQYLIERTLVDRQVWKYNSESKTWLLNSGLPHFR